MSDEVESTGTEAIKEVLQRAIELVDAGDLVGAQLLSRRATVAMDSVPRFEVEVAYEDNDGVHVTRSMWAAPTEELARTYAEEEVRAMLGSAVDVTSVVIR